METQGVTTNYAQQFFWSGHASAELRGHYCPVSISATGLVTSQGAPAGAPWTAVITATQQGFEGGRAALTIYAPCQHFDPNGEESGFVREMVKIDDRDMTTDGWERNSWWVPTDGSASYPKAAAAEKPVAHKAVPQVANDGGWAQLLSSSNLAHAQTALDETELGYLELRNKSVRILEGQLKKAGFNEDVDDLKAVLKMVGQIKRASSCYLVIFSYGVQSCFTAMIGSKFNVAVVGPKISGYCHPQLLPHLTFSKVRPMPSSMQKRSGRNS